MNAVELSTQLLLATQKDADTAPCIHQLSQISLEQLSSGLRREGSRRTFWINSYNAFTQLLVEKKSPNLLIQKSRRAFFNSKEIVIAGHSLSLNDIEHGMLRHSSVWWSKGYLQKLFPNSFEKKFRVPLDFRIHFALNCGAKSCPAIRFYHAEKLEEQLDEAMESFLQGEVSLDKRTRTATVSKIFDWYRGDFGGRNGIANLLWSQHIIPDNRKIKLRYRKYDWSILLHKFNA